MTKLTGRGVVQIVGDNSGEMDALLLYVSSSATLHSERTGFSFKSTYMCHIHVLTYFTYFDTI